MFRNISLSLADITGSEYIRGLVDSCDFFGTLSREEAERLAYEKIDFYPESAQKRNDELARLVGERVTARMSDSNDGAATDSFRHAENRSAAPL